MDSYLGELRLKHTQSDHCIYQRRNENGMLIIALYVDNLLIFADNLSIVSALKKELNAKFDMKDLQEAKYSLGLQITRD